MVGDDKLILLIMFMLIVFLLIVFVFMFMLIVFVLIKVLNEIWFDYISLDRFYVGSY